MIQVIKTKCCGKIFAACRDPECYRDSEWQKDIRSYASQGHKIEMVEPGKWKMEKCTCNDNKTSHSNSKAPQQVEAGS